LVEVSRDMALHRVRRQPKPRGDQVQRLPAGLTKSPIDLGSLLVAARDAPPRHLARESTRKPAFPPLMTVFPRWRPRLLAEIASAGEDY
jgi:hypothetical protein